MPIQAGQSYIATVNNAYLGESQNKGTPAIFFTFSVDHDGKPLGVIDHALWITDGTRDRVADTMNKCFGVTMEQLQSRVYLDNLANELSGLKVSISTIEEEYGGKSKVKVQWMNPEAKKPAGSLIDRAASFFGGAPAKSGNEPPPTPPPPDDSDF